MWYEDKGPASFSCVWTSALFVGDAVRKEGDRSRTWDRTWAEGERGRENGGAECGREENEAQPEGV